MDGIWFAIFIQGIGVVGMICAAMAFQCKKHKSIMIFRTANEMLFAVQYVFLGAYTGCAMNVFGSIRNIVFAEMVKRKKNTVPMRFVFSAIFIIFIALTWAGVKSILSGFAKVLSTFAYGSKNLVFMRVMILITSSCWLIYNLLVKSYAGVLSESITITSIVISMFRFKPKKTDNTAEQAAILIATEISEAENAGADCDKPDETTVSQNEITREADGQDGEAVTE